jgi:hypothetical protein
VIDVVSHTPYLSEVQMMCTCDPPHVCQIAALSTAAAAVGDRRPRGPPSNWKKGSAGRAEPKMTAHGSNTVPEPRPGTCTAGASLYHCCPSCAQSSIAALRHPRLRPAFDVYLPPACPESRPRTLHFQSFMPCPPRRRPLTRTRLGRRLNHSPRCQAKKLCDIHTK